MSAIIDYRGKSPTKVAFGIPLITAKIVKGGRVLEPDEFIAESDYNAWMRRGRVSRGDVVITTEAPLGEVAQLGDERVALAQRVILLRGDQRVMDNTFLRFALQSSFVRDQLFARQSGTTVLGIRQAELRRVLLPVPAIDEQRAIARVLSALDDKIALNRRMNRTLEATAAALFRSWFVDFDPVVAKAEGRRAPGVPDVVHEVMPATFTEANDRAIPKGWLIEPIGSLVRAVGGSTPSTNEPAYWNGAIRWATPRDMSRLEAPVLIEPERHITQAGIARISSGLLPVGTVLLSSRAPIGYCALTAEPMAVNQGFIALVCDGPLPNYYVFSWVRENMATIVSRANGTTFLEISKANFRPIPALRPSTEVLAGFSELVGPLYARIEANVRENITLAALRDTLLPQLLSGAVRLHAAERAVAAVS